VQLSDFGILGRCILYEMSFLIQKTTQDLKNIDTLNNQVPRLVKEISPIIKNPGEMISTGVQ